MKATFVWDNGMSALPPLVPEEMGTAREDQLTGSSHEALGELAGRVCYDSLGQGRDSDSYHGHILDTRNTSVYEHCAVVMQCDAGSFGSGTLLELVGRPGVWLRRSDDGQGYRLTLNPRTLLDWVEFPMRGLGLGTASYYFLRDSLVSANMDLFPRVLGRLWKEISVDTSEKSLSDAGFVWDRVQPESDEERWVTMFMSGSRGFSHEQVRHGDFSAISQRSTRYVDESESPWVEHPLLSTYVAENPTYIDYCGKDGANGNKTFMVYDRQVKPLIKAAKNTYAGVAGMLEEWLIGRGVDRASARKQARGAARGYLGNALATEMIFSASVAQWRWMLRQRCSPFADAEIREIYVRVLEQLCEMSSHRERFFDMRERLVASPDGIGRALAL